MKTPHGPNCLACTDPETARRQIAADRAELDTHAARAAAHREAGEAARREYLTPGIDDATLTAAQQRMLDELGAANGIAQAVRMHRAHLDRIEAAHWGGDVR